MDPRTSVRTLPTVTVRTVAALVAEGHVLAEWSRDTQHPRLKEAYEVLAATGGPRARALVEACAREDPQARRAIVSESLRLQNEARTITFELSRLKWLLAARRDRLQHEALPGHAVHREEEEMEAELLDTLLQRLRRGVC